MAFSTISLLACSNSYLPWLVISLMLFCIKLSGLIYSNSARTFVTNSNVIIGIYALVTGSDLDSD